MINQLKTKIKKFWKWLVGISVGVALASTLIPLAEIPSVVVEGQTISFPYTDENSNENLLIWTDKAEYSNLFSWNNFDIYVMVKNKSGKGQIANLQFFFPRSDITVNSIQTIKPNSLYEIIVEEFATTTVIDATTSKEIIQTIKTGEHKEIRTGNVWTETELLGSDNPEKEIWLATGTLKEKPKPNQLPDKKVQFPILKNGIAYFKVNIQVPSGGFSKEEFYLEAVGNNSAYGLLDPTVLSDDFNSYIDGDLNTQGNWATGSIYTAIANVQAATAGNPEGSGKEIYIAQVNGKETIIFKDGSSTSGGTYVIYLKSSAVTGNNLRFSLRIGAGDHVLLSQWSGAVLKLNDNATWRDIKTDMAANTWYLIEVSWESTNHTWKARVNGGAWSSNYLWAYAGTTAPSRFFFDIWSTATVNYWFDYIAEFPYAPSVEPEFQAIIIE